MTDFLSRSSLVEGGGLECIWLLEFYRGAHLISNDQGKVGDEEFKGLNNLRPTQVTRFQSLVQKDPMCHGATKPVHSNCCSWNAREPGLQNRRSHHNKKPVHHS